jgi:hypothetical protein
MASALMNGTPHADKSDQKPARPSTEARNPTHRLACGSQMMWLVYMRLQHAACDFCERAEVSGTRTRLH